MLGLGKNLHIIFKVVASNHVIPIFGKLLFPQFLKHLQRHSWKIISRVDISISNLIFISPGVEIDSHCDVVANELDPLFGGILVIFEVFEDVFMEVVDWCILEEVGVLIHRDIFSVFLNSLGLGHFGFPVVESPYFFEILSN